MKIGIISINAHTRVLNFASPLHTYAFQQFLLNNGIETTIIDYKPIYYGAFDAKHPLFYYVNHPSADIEKWKATLKLRKQLFYEREYRYNRFEEFVEKHYIKTEKCYDQKSLDIEDPGFDCYICATDVIWKCNPKTGFDRGYFLACKQMEGKKKIAYSASRGPSTGKTQYTEKREKEFIDYISDFDYVSVREESLKKYIEGVINVPVTRVLDPVFLLEREFYSGLAVRPKKKGYCLIYTVMENAAALVSLAVAFAANNGLDIIDISDRPTDIKIPKGISYLYRYDLGIEDWLGYMENAGYIFTNSFHACCFSIIFQKQFYAGKRAGDKVDCILETFQLSWRRFGDTSTLDDLAAPDIDYDTVNKLRCEYTKMSAQYILNAIHYLEEHPHRSHADKIIHKPE